MTKTDLEAQLTLIEERAPRLRQAGVLSLSIGDVQLELAPAELPDPPMGDDDDEDEPKSALDDPATFGRTGKGAKVPGRSKRDQEHNS